MNEYFCLPNLIQLSSTIALVGKDLAEKIEYAPNPLLSVEYNVNPEEKCFSFQTIDVRKIRDAIGKIKTSKGFGTDFSSYFLKLAMPYIENSLAHFFNTSLELFP